MGFPAGGRGGRWWQRASLGAWPCLPLHGSQTRRRGLLWAGRSHTGMLGRAWGQGPSPGLTQAALGGYTGHAQTLPKATAEHGDSCRGGWEGTRVSGGAPGCQALLRPHPPPGTSGPHLRDFAPAALTPSPECGRLLPATQEWAPGSPLPGGDWPAVACALLATVLTSPWFLSLPATWARPRPGQQPRGLGPVPRGPGGAVPRRPVPAGRCPRPPGTPGPLCLQPPGL